MCICILVYIMYHKYTYIHICVLHTSFPHLPDLFQILGGFHKSSICRAKPQRQQPVILKKSLTAMVMMVVMMIPFVWLWYSSHPRLMVWGTSCKDYIGVMFLTHGWVKMLPWHSKDRTKRLLLLHGSSSHHPSTWLQVLWDSALPGFLPQSTFHYM